MNEKTKMIALTVGLLLVAAFFAMTMHCKGM